MATKPLSTKAKQKLSGRGVKRVSVAFSDLPKSIRDYMNREEGTTAARIAGDQEAAKIYRDFLKISDLTGKERDERMDELRKIAEGSLRPYFDQQKKDIQDTIKLNIESLNEKFNVLSEQEKRDISLAIDKMNYFDGIDTRDTINDLSQRNVLNSGMLKIMARRMTDRRALDVRSLEQDRDHALENAELAKKLGLKREQLEEGIDLRALDRQKTKDIEKEAEDMAGQQEREQKEKLVELGVAEIDPETGNLRFTVPEAELQRLESTPKETSQQQAQRLQQEGSSLEEQRKQRDELMFPDGVPERSSTLTPRGSNRPRTPASSSTPLSRSSTPPPRSSTPPPRSSTPPPRSSTPPPRSSTPPPRGSNRTPTPRSTTPPNPRITKKTNPTVSLAERSRLRASSRK